MYERFSRPFYISALRLRRDPTSLYGNASDTDPTVLEKLLASISAQRLVAVCGASLSMGEPSISLFGRTIGQDGPAARMRDLA